jgi:NifU-like protein
VITVTAFYPPKIDELFASPEHAGKPAGTNAIGTAASFSCGSFVRISMRIDPQSKEILAAGFQTNGCGFMAASAEAICRLVESKKLTDLHGKAHTELRAKLVEFLGQMPPSRDQCLNVCLDALTGAFSDFRSYLIEEFSGEKPLICTCFGVTEEAIEQKITELHLTTLEEVSAATRAGQGCGSCHMLIREILDMHGK